MTNKQKDIEFQPYIPDEQTPPELTWTSLK